MSSYETGRHLLESALLGPRRWMGCYPGQKVTKLWSTRIICIVATMFPHGSDRQEVEYTMLSVSCHAVVRHSVEKRTTVACVCVRILQERRKKGGYCNVVVLH